MELSINYSNGSDKLFCSFLPFCFSDLGSFKFNAHGVAI